MSNNINENGKKNVSKKIDYKAIIIWVIFIIALIFFIFFIYNEFFNKKSSLDVKKVLDNNETMVIYVYNSDSKKCSKCNLIKKHLDKKGIKYTSFDVNGNTSSYDKLLKDLSIDKNVFNYPAVIYLDSGIMYANIINVEDVKTVDSFIKDYNLK